MNPENYRNQLLFLRHPDGFWAVGSGRFRRQSEPDLNSPSFYAPDFFLHAEEPWIVPEVFESVGDEQWSQKVPGRIYGRTESVNTAWHLLREWSEPDYFEFEQAFSEIQAIIHNGGLEKVVPIVFSQAERSPDFSEKFHLLKRCIASPHKLIAYGGWWGSEGLIGLTPEILFTQSPNFVETMALAGTAAAEAASLLEDTKQTFEHEVVVRDLFERLSQFGKVKKTPVREWHLGQLKHLRTDIAVEAAVEFSDLIKCLHPTPALGGYPRDKAMQWLSARKDATMRQRFGAPFGIRYPDGRGFCVVAIRNIQWKNDAILLGAGCGVVRDSRLNEEWQELKLKRDSVRHWLEIL